MTISLTAVFIPILFLGGIVGRLFHEFAVVIAVSILVSGFVSLTLTPMLSSRFLRPHEHDEKHGRAYQITEAGYDWLLAKYKGSLEWVMIHRPLAMAFSFAILVGTVVLFILVLAASRSRSRTRRASSPPASSRSPRGSGAEAR